MKIIIDGAGEVGTHLARLLSRENHDITVIDSDAIRLNMLDSSCNLLTVCGSNTSFAILDEAGTSNADLFIAVTPYEDANTLACAIAKSLGAKRTVARVDNYEFMQKKHSGFFNAHGVDALIYPELLAAREILSSLERTWARNWFELHDGELIVVGVKIRANAQIVGQSLRDISRTHHHYHVSAIKRNHETIIPRGDDTVQVNDILYFTTRREHTEPLRELCGKKSNEIRNVLIVGGSRIAVRLVTLATDKYRFKIIESDPARCRYIAERCPDARVCMGDARDMDVLVEEGIRDQHAFVALTGSSETNIITCLSAKEYGVSKTIAEVENIQFISEAENLNIGTIINKKLLASGKIFQMLLDADVDSSKFMALADADVAEIEVKPKSKITKAAVKDLNLSRYMTIAGMIRNGRGELVGGNTRLEAGDHVLVFCLTGFMHKVEKLFN